MRTGAISREVWRGSCGALKWMALFGVVFALGVGSAAAQITIKPTTADSKKVAEGSSLDISVEVKAWRGGATAQGPGSVTITATAGATRSANVTNEASDIALNPATTTVTFPSERAGATGRQETETGTITLQTTHDPDAEDEKVELTFTIGTTDLTTDGTTAITAPTATLVVTIDDDETQNYVLTLDSGETPKEGGEFDLTIKADPAFVHGMQNIRLHLSDSMYKLTTPADGSVTLGDDDATDNTGATNALDGAATADEQMMSIVVKAPANDKNRSEDTLTIRALDSASSKELGMLEVKVADNNPLPEIQVMVVDDEGEARDPQPASLTEGDSVKIMATAVDKDGKAMKAAEKLTISLAPQAGMGMAGMRDYSLSMHPITIDKDKTSSASVTLMAESDDEVDMETLTFDASVAGDSTKGSGTRDVMGVLSLMIEDDTSKLVWAKTQTEVETAIYAAKEAGMGADEKFNPGEMIEVMGGALFNAAEGVMVSYTAMSDSDSATTSVSNDGMVKVTAGDMEGMAHITITAHASMPSGVKILDQDDPAEASIVFPVDVMMEALVLTLMGPEDMNVAEGESAEVTVMANRAVTEDMEVMLMRDRAMSSASDDDFTAGSIMLKAGEEMATGMVMAVEDEMAEDMEELVLYAMAGDMEVMGTAKLYIWDAAVPALPIIAQLLLAGLLGVGGYRRYRRR